MSGYDEVKPDPNALPVPYSGPRVERDCNHVSKIAANARDFALHVKPRYYRGRDDEWRKED